MSLAVVMAAGYMALRPAAERPDEITRSDPQTELAQQYLPLLRKGKQAMEDGEAVRAMDYFDQALIFVPGDKEIRALREQAEAMILGSDMTLEQARVADALQRAESALGSGQYDEAVRLAQSALVLEPENERALRVIGEAEDGKQRLKDAKDRVHDRFIQPRSTPQNGEAPVPGPAPAAVRETASLKIEFFSELPEGILTVYVGATKFFHQNFKFTQESGGLIKRQVKSSGRLSYTERVKVGEKVKLRVYVWLGSSQTKTHELDTSFAADEEKTLDIRVDRDGKVDLNLR